MANSRATKRNKMGQFIKQLGQTVMNTAAGGVGGALGGLMGMAFQGANDRRQVKQQKKLQDLEIKGQQQMTDYNMQKQLEMWEKTGYGAQKEQMKEAGINPALMYGMGGGGGQSANVATGHVTGGQAPSGGGEVGMGIQAGLNMQLMDAQRKVLESQAKLNTVEADKKAGVDTANVSADTENKILEGVIKKYTGKETQAQYEIKQGVRGVEAKTWQDELEARQGVAGTIYELWSEGKLHEKSVAEIESILLKNAQTREETRRIIQSMDLLEENIKGAKLDNIIKDLEAKLQTETGIDRNSAGWLKVVGRLFVNIFGGGITPLKKIVTGGN